MIRGEAPADRAAKPVSVGFSLPKLDGGGAERMTLNLLLPLKVLGYAPFLIVGSQGGELWPIVPPEIETFCLGTRGWALGFVRLMKLLRARKPAVLISSMGRCNLLSIWAGALGGADTKIVIREHAIVSTLAKLSAGRGALVPAFYRVFARWADAVVTPSVGVADDMVRIAHLPPHSIRVIHNPVLTPNFDRELLGPVDHPFFAPGGPPVFLSIGRLSAEKDVATLVAAFALFRSQRIGRLVLIGDGPLRAELQAQCLRLGIAEDVAFLGFRDDRIAFLRCATALMLPSLVEGFSNVLVEALAAGTPIISTDCPTGPRFILEGGRFGVLVPVGDSGAMATAMIQAVERPWSTVDGRAHAGQFTADRAALQYAALIEELRPRSA